MSRQDEKPPTWKEFEELISTAEHNGKILTFFEIVGVAVFALAACLAVAWVVA